MYPLTLCDLLRVFQSTCIPVDVIGAISSWVKFVRFWVLNFGVQTRLPFLKQYTGFPPLLMSRLHALRQHQFYASPFPFLSSSSPDLPLPSSSLALASGVTAGLMRWKIGRTRLPSLQLPLPMVSVKSPGLPELRPHLYPSSSSFLPPSLFLCSQCATGLAWEGQLLYRSGRVGAPAKRPTDQVH